jgi:hypothetical protein
MNKLTISTGVLLSVAGLSLIAAPAVAAPSSFAQVISLPDIGTLPDTSVLGSVDVLVDAVLPGVGATPVLGAVADVSGVVTAPSSTENLVADLVPSSLTDPLGTSSLGSTLSGATVSSGTSLDLLQGISLNRGGLQSLMTTAPSGLGTVLLHNTSATVPLGNGNIALDAGVCLSILMPFSQCSATALPPTTPVPPTTGLPENVGIPLAGPVTAQPVSMASLAALAFTGSGLLVTLSAVGALVAAGLGLTALRRRNAANLLG